MTTPYITNPISSNWPTSYNTMTHYTTNNGDFEISAPRYNLNGAAPIYRLLDGLATASSKSNFETKRITYPISRGLLQVWFKLPNSYVLNNFKLFNDNNIASFNLKTASSITDETGTALTISTPPAESGSIYLDGSTGTNNSYTLEETYTITNNTIKSEYYLLDITAFEPNKTYCHLTELEFGYDPKPPPNVGFPSSPSTNGTVSIDKHDATSWEYSLDSGSTWENGSGTSFSLPPGTYAIDNIHVRSYYSGAVSSFTVKNDSEIIINLPPPNVDYSNSSSTKTVIVTITGYATSWEYSLDSGSNWENGSGTSFPLSPGTYGINAIQVRSKYQTSTSETVNNTSEIIITPAEFDTTIANNKKTDLVVLIASQPSVNTVRELYNLWYNTTQTTGGTEVWAYYAYEQTDNSIAYNTQKFEFNPDTESWSNLDLSASLSVSVSSNGLSGTDLADFDVLYTGLEPFQVNVSTDSIASLTTVYTNSSYTTYNASQMYNIWYDEPDTFDATFNNTTRTVDIWTYLLTDAPEDTSGNLIFETRKVRYTIQNNNSNYTWSIPTNEIITTSTHPDYSGYSLSLDTGYSSIPDNNSYKLAFFHFNIYTLTRFKLIIQLGLQYSSTISQYDNSHIIDTINEIWYDKTVLNTGTYDASFNDALLDEPNVKLKIYGSGSYGDASYNTFDISYNKNTRNLLDVNNDISNNIITSGLNDEIYNDNFQQIYYNVFYNITQTISSITNTYNNTYPDPGLDTITSLWDNNSNIEEQTMTLFVGFVLNNEDTVKYTTLSYNRIENTWLITNATEEYNPVLAQELKYSEFTPFEINGFALEIKEVYNTTYTSTTIIDIHNVWYDNRSISNNTVICLLFYSYKNNDDPVVKTYFAIIPINYNRYNIQDDIEPFFSISDGTISNAVEYSYTNIDDHYIELTDYSQIPTFTINTTGNPIMISNNVIYSQFDASYVEITSATAVSDIHTIWTSESDNVLSINDTNTVYSVPIITMWVYFSYENPSGLLYESRDISYNLQLNKWIITNNDNNYDATNRTNAIDTNLLTNYKQVYISLPILPAFSTVSAKTISSLDILKNTYAASESISAGSLEILNLWYRLSDSQEEFVKCIVYLSISSLDANENITNNYKTFIINYNNDTNDWIMPAINISVNSSDTDDGFDIIITNQNEQTADYFLFYAPPSGPYIQVTKNKIMMNNSQHLNLPVGSILMFHKSISYGDAWLICDGTEYEVADYPELASVLNEKYGSVSTDKFNVPNLVDCFPIGANGPGDTTISTTDEHKDASLRTGGSWTIDSDQFVHDHPETSHTYIYGVNRHDKHDDEVLLDTFTVNQKLGPINTNEPTGPEHKPQYFVVQYIIYTGRHSF